MRWIRNVVLLCIGLGMTPVWPVIAQDVAGNAKSEVAIVTADTMVQTREYQTRWALQPYFGGSSESKTGSFGFGSDNRQGIRLLIGGKVRAYPGTLPRLSLDLAGYFQLPAFQKKKRGRRLSQATFDANIYLRADTKKVRPYLTFGMGFLSNNRHRSTTIGHFGAGLEIGQNKRYSIPIGVYSDLWSDNDRVLGSLLYLAIGVNIYQY